MCTFSIIAVCQQFLRQRLYPATIVAWENALCVPTDGRVARLTTAACCRLSPVDEKDGEKSACDFPSWPEMPPSLQVHR
eukprot:COSAG02_NODE_46716_length_346_cov_1.874494_1_plen_78_part_10